MEGEREGEREKEKRETHREVRNRQKRGLAWTKSTAHSKPGTIQKERGKTDRKRPVCVCERERYPSVVYASCFSACSCSLSH